MRRWSLTLISFLTLIGMGLPIQAHGVDAIPDEQFSIQELGAANFGNQNLAGVLFEESVDTLRMPTLLYGLKIVDGRQFVLSLCTSLIDPQCAEANLFKYYSLFKPCVGESDVDCIDSVYAYNQKTPVRIRGSFTETIPAKVANPFVGAKEFGLPQGGNAGLWRIPGVTHGGKNEDYAVIFSSVGTIQRTATGFKKVPNMFGQGGDFRAAIFPVTLLKNALYRENIAKIESMAGRSFIGISHPSRLDFSVCALVADGLCAIRQAFPKDVSFGLSVRFSSVVNGWFHGRIQSPQIDYQLTSYGSRIDVQGQALSVPILAGWVNLAAVKKAANPDFPEMLIKGEVSYPGPSGDQAMKNLVTLSSLLNDKAAAYPKQWIFYNLHEGELAESNNCITNSKTLAGFVATNSTTYGATPPIYNQNTGTLEYKVASAHFLPDGSVFKGQYDLYIDGKVARCIYKLSAAPISATVTILSETGIESVASTTLTEEAGWLHLNAQGFTFSNPTLKIKLNNSEGTANNVKKSDQLVVAAKEAKTKIIAVKCKKSGVIKVVKAVNPQCPKGYKKI